MEPLNKEDYVEPRCLLCGDPYGVTPEVRSVPQRRIIDKMNEYMSRRDYAGAERHLLYWLEEAKLGNDLRGQLMIRGELIGHYRKVGDRDKALENIDEALTLIDRLDFANTISAGTTFVNAATACNAFGENNRAMELFEKARAIYESAPGTSPELLGGLYNNMALTLCALGRYSECFAFYDKALEQMGKVNNGELESAITCLNIANAVEAETGLEAGESRIFDLLDKAEALLFTPSLPRDGYYAFVLEKCAPTFSYYGYFLTAQKLTEISEAIYRENIDA